MIWDQRHHHYQLLQSCNEHFSNLHVVFLQGTIDQFDYPKKGKNIPPSKHDAPVREDPEEVEEDQAAQSFYDENGNRVEEVDQEYGAEDGQQEEGYGEEQAEYGNEGEGEGEGQQQEYDEEGYGDEAQQDYGEEGGQQEEY